MHNVSVAFLLFQCSLERLERHRNETLKVLNVFSSANAMACKPANEKISLEVMITKVMISKKRKIPNKREA